jgi:hypothetical protein
MYLCDFLLSWKRVFNTFNPVVSCGVCRLSSVFVSWLEICNHPKKKKTTSECVTVVFIVSSVYPLEVHSDVWSIDAAEKVGEWTIGRTSSGFGCLYSVCTWPKGH